MLLPIIVVALILRLGRAAAAAIAPTVIARICGHFKLGVESSNARNEDKVDPSLRFNGGQVNGELGTKAV